MFDFFITGTKGFETPLFHEIREIVSTFGDLQSQVKKVYGGVEIRGGLQSGYAVCLHSRLANRVFLQLTRFKAVDEQALYEGVYAIDWSQHLTPSNSLAVSASLSRSFLTHSHYAALKVKDAVVDFFRDRVNARPSVKKQQPDLHLHLNLHQNQAMLSMDFSGESLHRRGYRLEHSGAPLKEHLAAALLYQAGWTRETAMQTVLLDPMCGSGTFAIEAALLAANIAPGLDRDYFGFKQWLQHDRDSWQSLLQQAEAAIHKPENIQIHASDIDKRAVAIARDNAMRADVEELIQFKVSDLNQLDVIEASNMDSLLMLSNPPYGERLEAEQGMARLYSDIGRVFQRCCAPFKQAQLALISANPDLLHRMRLKRIAKKDVNNGPIKCQFVQFEDTQSPEASAKPEPQAHSAIPRVSSDHQSEQEAEGLKNRLQKNLKHLSKWAKRQAVSCFRAYDADLPEFAFALDVYQSVEGPVYLHLQEYQPPKTVDAEKALARIEIAKQVVCEVFDIADAQLHVKLRRRQKGAEQYEKLDHQRKFIVVEENGARLQVNLADYLDTGLFLDHRITRQLVRDRSNALSVLNLFCYTASVSVHAALGGAAQVTSVDMSATYLNWAQENFRLNNLSDEQRYRFLQADCTDLLKYPKKYLDQEKFDVIFLDPPSFSNSKKMTETLDIQRDHVSLIEQSLRLLKPNGVLFFSTNRRGFKLDKAITERFNINDISRKTLPEDFKRRPNIHQCWEIHLQDE